MAKMITMSESELTALLERTAKQAAQEAIASIATQPKIKAKKTDNSLIERAMALHARVIEAAKKDTVKDSDGHYGSYTGHFIILKGLQKYGDKAEFKPTTILAAARDYGFWE